MHPTNAPVKNDIYKANIIPGNPKINPIKKENLTSPNPIPLPFVIKNKIRKKAKAPNPEDR